MSERTASSRLAPVVGPDLCLSYANTLFWRGSEHPSEGLGSFGHLVAWLEVQTGMAAADAAALTKTAEDAPEQAAALFSQAISLREAMFGVFTALAQGERAPDGDFAALAHAIEHAPKRERLVRNDEGYAWRIPHSAFAAPDLLAPVVWSAADLLVSGGDGRVRRCANDKCLWLFIDESKNGTRRWCDMSACGNRAKARRHYLKHRQKSG